MKDEIRGEEEEFVSIKDKTEELLSEVEIRSRLVEDLEHQIFERQGQLVEKTEIAKRLKTELELRNQTINFIKKRI